MVSFGTEIAGATGQSYTPLINGTYSVAVTYPPGCSTVSDTFVVISVHDGTIPANANAVIAPNPFDANTMLQLADNYQLVNSTLIILDARGKQVSAMHQLYGNSIKFSEMDCRMEFISSDFLTKTTTSWQQVNYSFNNLTRNIRFLKKAGKLSGYFPTIKHSSIQKLR